MHVLKTTLRLVTGGLGIACIENDVRYGIANSTDSVHWMPGMACTEDNFEAGHGGLRIACIENDVRYGIANSTDHGESSNGYSHGKPGIACIEDNFDACHRMPSVVSSDDNFEVPVQEVMGYGHAGRLLQWIREESFDINMGDDPGF